MLTIIVSSRDLQCPRKRSRGDQPIYRRYNADCINFYKKTIIFCINDLKYQAFTNICWYNLPFKNLIYLISEKKYTFRISSSRSMVTSEPTSLSLPSLTTPRNTKWFQQCLNLYPKSLNCNTNQSKLLQTVSNTYTIHIKWTAKQHIKLIQETT